MQRYTALTASSQLTCLKLLDDNDGIAFGAAQYMFSEGKKLPHLKQLHMGMYETEWETEIDETLKPFGAGDIARLAAACPALEQFWTVGALQKDVDISSLTQLTAVTQLKVGGFDLNGEDLAAALAEMEQLRDVTVIGIKRFGPGELARLAECPNLRRLLVHDCEALEGDLEDIDLSPKVLEDLHATA
jgi:hypothetical protein